MAKFRKVQFDMTRANGYGQYYIISTYKGVNIKIHTSDSEVWDYLNSDCEKGKDSRRYCYNKIVNAYKNIQL